MSVRCYVTVWRKVHIVDGGKDDCDIGAKFSMRDVKRGNEVKEE
jgi:hypothetical protein